MRKLVLIALALVLALGATAQNKTISARRVLIDSTLIWQGDTIDFNSYIGSGVALEHLRFDSAAAIPAHREGLLFYDSLNKSLSYYNDQREVSNQLGRELWTRCYNGSGADLPNGTVVYLDTSYQGRPTIRPAQANTDTTVCRILGLTTQGIGSGEFGEVCTHGEVRGLNTSALTMRGEVYVSPTTAGAYTSTRPVYPDYEVVVGSVLVVDATEGVIFVTRSGATTFLGLSDTPASYAGQGGKVVKVAGGETALEFAAESDPVFSASVASQISAADTVAYRTAYNWGNHAAAGYLTAETDPVYVASVAAQIRAEDTLAYRTAYERHITGSSFDTGTGVLTLNQEAGGAITQDLDGRYITGETDPVYSASVASEISAADTAAYREAYSWGDHADAGYLTTESDPVFSASVASQISAADTTAYRAAYSWGNHAAAGYITTESDPVYSASVAAEISAADTAAYRTAYKWGNHATAGYVTTEEDPVFVASPAGSITNTNKTQWTTSYNWGNHATAGYITTESDPVFTASPAGSITNTNKTQWTTAYNWGDHSTEGYLTSESDPVFSASVAAGINSTNTTNWTAAYNDKINSASFAPSTGEVTLTQQDGGTVVVDIDGRYLTSFTESDPVFSASVAAEISAADTTAYRAAYNWGNHAAAGYLTTESDPVFVASPAGSITNTNKTQWTTAYNWGNHAASGYLTTESDPVFTASPAGSITNTNKTQWNTAYGWGNHATVGYLTSFTESDPVFSVSAAAAISGTNISNWNSAYSWGDHATVGYLTSFTESDPVFGASVAAEISAADTAAYREAYSWGDHADAGYITTESDPVFTASVASEITAADTTDYRDAFDNKIVQMSFNTGTGVLGLIQQDGGVVTKSLDGRYLTSFTESDPIFSVSTAAGISGTNISNWNSAYSWGNHSGLYDPLGTAASTLSSHTSTFNHSNFNTAYSWGNHATAGYLTTESDPVFEASPAKLISGADTLAWFTAYDNMITSVSFNASNGNLGLYQQDGGIVSGSMDGRYSTRAFKNIAVSGQTTVEADNLADTLTLVAGTNVTISTSGDQITIDAAGTGATAFTDLTDAPSSYTGHAKKVVTVNPNADALVFTDPFRALGLYYGVLYTDTINRAYTQKTWTKIINWTAGAYEGMTLDAANGVLTIDNAGTYDIVWALAEWNDDGGNTRFILYLNGNPVTYSQVPSKYAPDRSLNHPGGSFILDLVATDKIELYFISDAVDGQLDIYGGYLKLKRIK